MLDGERLHGYEIAQRIRQGVSFGVSEGALYPTLHRLERRGSLVAMWGEGEGGPRRRYYTLTERGSQQLREARAEWEDFVSKVGAITGTTEEATRA